MTVPYRHGQFHWNLKFILKGMKCSTSYTCTNGYASDQFNLKEMFSLIIKSRIIIVIVFFQIQSKTNKHLYQYLTKESC